MQLINPPLKSVLSGIERRQNRLALIMNPNTLTIQTESAADHITADFVLRNYKDGVSLVYEKLDVTCKKSDLIEYFIDSGYQMIAANRDCMATKDNVLIDMDFKNWSVRLMILSTPTQAKQIAADITQRFESNPCFVKYIYDPQYMEYTTMPVNTDRLPVQEMYPYLKESLSEYYDRYIKSSSNILILIGGMGTGKTSFLRGMLSHARQSAMVAYHHKIIEQDSFFVQWMESSDMFMILEDSDILLTPREDGNDVMSKFLNVGDGLVSFKGKKLIFSTNLPNISSIDSALTRGGRCFDILQFRALEGAEISTLCNKFGIAAPDKNVATVSEIFAPLRNDPDHSLKKRTFGFL